MNVNCPSRTASKKPTLRRDLSVRAKALARVSMIETLTCAGVQRVEDFHLIGRRSMSTTSVMSP